MQDLKIKYSIVMVLAFLISTTLMPLAIAVSSDKMINDSSMPIFSEWARPMNLSQYSGHKEQIKPKPLSQKELENISPFIIVLNESEKERLSNIHQETCFKQVDFVSDRQVSVIMPVNAMELQKKKDKTRADPDVRITQIIYTWYWVQDLMFNNDVSIHNYGTSTVSGKVLFWSLEDGYGYYKTFNNLAPGSTMTVSTPFKPIIALSSIGIKPIAFEVRVDPGDVSTDFANMPYDGIEKYNNGITYLSDPDGGENLGTSDLYHFPFEEGYRIISEAALAGDNTTTPYETANKINSYVKKAMHYDDEIYLSRSYTASDLWVVNHKNATGHYIGVCDEYVALFDSFARSLGIPSKYYLISYLNVSNSSGGAHAISEVWDGNEWIHSDPTWDIFNEPQIYIQNNFTNIRVWNMKNADDSRDNNDPFGDQLLHFWNDFETVDLGYLAKYN